MSMHRRTSLNFLAIVGMVTRFNPSCEVVGPLRIALLLLVVLLGRAAYAQVNVVTAHNDIERTGQNLHETLLTHSSVNENTFGKLFSQSVSGAVYAQPLYVSQVAIPGKGTHNVVYVTTATTNSAPYSYVYAFDADSNGGIAASPLWVTPLLKASSAPGYKRPNFGAVGTPVIDLTSNLLYVVSSELAGTATVFKLHALDITTGAEKLGGPLQITGSVAGTGNGSSGGVLTFDPVAEFQRPGLLLLKGFLYIAFASQNDNGAWHGWIFSYNAATLQQINIYCASPNGAAAGFWMSGAGLAAEINPATGSYGSMFVASGNGDYTATKPYTNTMSYGMSILNLDLTGGTMKVLDEFTPYNENHLDGEDGDLGSGGVMILPSSGSLQYPLVQMGKSGIIYLLDRTNLGGFNASSDTVVQEIQTPQAGTNNWGAGIWGAPAYWNTNIYFSGTQYAPLGQYRAANSMNAYSFLNGKISTTPTSSSTAQFAYPGPTPSISANNNSDAIVWAVETDAYPTNGVAILYAFDATNLASQLYSSGDNAARDTAGPAVKYVAPTIANGKVYVGATNEVDIYGLFSTAPAAAAPVFSPRAGLFAGSQTISISDGTSGASIYYTTDGSTPTTASTLYTRPFSISSSETISAIASATGYLQSPVTSASYVATTNAANPVFSLSGGTYNGAQTLTISDSSSGSTIYYTVDGTTPTTSSSIYKQPIAISVSETVQAIATAPNLLASSVVSATYTIDPLYTFDFSQGFSQAQGPIQFNGSTDLDDFRLQLTNGNPKQAGSAFYATPVNIQAFTTDFTLQQSNAVADGMTFTIQNVGPGALGTSGGSLGYRGIAKSVAIKFDLYNNSGEGMNSTGLYQNGAVPELPAIDLTGTGINLHSGDYINVHLTYDGVNLNLTLTDAFTLATWSHAFAVDIPNAVGGTTAYVGFTASTGGSTSSQKLTSWTYVTGPPAVPNYPAGFDNQGLLQNGTSLSGQSLELVNGKTNQATSAYYSTQVEISSFTTDFDFQISKNGTTPPADGFTFIVQQSGPTAVGKSGSNLGFAPIAKSVAIKFDIYNNLGEGSDSTGVYVNGASPTTPAIDLTSTNVILSSGDQLHVHITYDGTTLTWTITDATLASHPSATNSFAINIPHTIGSDAAYVGFTASSGGATSIQNILDWTFTSL